MTTPDSIAGTATMGWNLHRERYCNNGMEFAQGRELQQWDGICTGKGIATMGWNLHWEGNCNNELEFAK
jgi:hypothetical protein